MGLETYTILALNRHHSAVSNEQQSFIRVIGDQLLINIVYAIHYIVVA